jgi:hypothetical protein
MSLFSTGPASRPLNRANAWGYVAANQFLWPGLGTALAKRKAGLVQMGVSGAGFVMFMIGAFGYGIRWWNFISFSSNYQPGWRDQYVLTGLGGVGLVAFTWIWCCFSGYGLLREARRREAALPPRLNSLSPQ